MLAMYILGEQKRGSLEIGGEGGVALEAGVLGQGRGWGEGEEEAQHPAGHFRYPRSEKVAR